VHGAFGLAIASCWPIRHIIALAPFVCGIVAIIYLLRARVLRRIIAELPSAVRVSLLLWLTFIAFCVALVHVQVRWPEKLQEGMYIFQKHRLNTKVQRLTGLPADNYIPYTVTEFLLRGISFKANHRSCRATR
jgi:hypothetical protein